MDTFSTVESTHKRIAIIAKEMADQAATTAAIFKDNAEVYNYEQGKAAAHRSMFYILTGERI